MDVESHISNSIVFIGCNNMIEEIENIVEILQEIVMEKKQEFLQGSSLLSFWHNTIPLQQGE